MKLSELIGYYNELNQMTCLTSKSASLGELDKINYLVKNQKVQLHDCVRELESQQNIVLQSFDLYEQKLDSLKQQVKNIISETEKSWFVESYRLYDQEMANETIEEIQARTTNNISQDTESFYISRLSKYNNWSHPAMIIRPGFEPYLNHLVACDPLYVVDLAHELLKPSVSQHNEVYQQRLRQYVVNERDHDKILDKLPDNQFGLVFVYNFFNFRPLEIIKRYLEEIYSKLRTGGTLIMTFNDCDRDKAVRLVEQHFCCYTPGYLVIDLAKSLGFELTLSWNDQGPSTWLELRKPGEFKSFRGGQSLAKIIPK
jgi:SAM-dependent methyltransferase